ncbi:hypothetical protein WS76_09355 [Burkholderia humptydooensis]|nr:hypothetical protein WS76_09355 [Burkholderia humptydooensis]
MSTGIEVDDRVRRYEASLVGAQRRIDFHAHARHVLQCDANAFCACRADLQHERRCAVVGCNAGPHLRQQQLDGVAVAQIGLHDARDQDPQPVVEMHCDPGFEVGLVDQPLDRLADQVLARARQLGGGIRQPLSMSVLAEPACVAFGVGKRVARLVEHARGVHLRALDDRCRVDISGQRRGRDE